MLLFNCRRSLLAPAIEIAENKFEQWAFLPVAIGKNMQILLIALRDDIITKHLGFAIGAAFVELSDHFIPS